MKVFYDSQKISETESVNVNPVFMFVCFFNLNATFNLISISRYVFKMILNITHYIFCSATCDRLVLNSRVELLKLN